MFLFRGTAVLQRTILHNKHAIPGKHWQHTGRGCELRRQQMYSPTRQNAPAAAAAAPYAARGSGAAAGSIRGAAATAARPPLQVIESNSTVCMN